MHLACEIMAWYDGLFLDLEAGLLRWVDGVDCYGVVTDDYVVGRGRGDVAVGNAKRSVRGVYEC